MSAAPPIRAYLTIGLLSVAILGFLFWLIYADKGVVRPNAGDSPWPALNATCNALSATCVALGIWAIRRDRKKFHAVCMIAATFFSACFLVGYIIYHAQHGDTRFFGQGWVRPVYFFILISHIVLSLAVVPLILTTLYFAAVRQFSRHRRIARWTYPVWLYVSLTGIAVFFFLKYANG